MALNTLLGQPTDQQIKALPARLRNPERIKQHLDAFALHLQGVSFRGIQNHFGWKSLSTAQNSVRRGEELAKKLNLDSEKIRLKIAAAFDELADITIQQVKEQVAEGRITQIVHGDGSKEVRRTKGVDPRLVGEAGRGLIRFAQFAGLMDDTASTAAAGEVSTNVIFINPTADGASWDQQLVDVTPENGLSEHKSGHVQESTPPDALQSGGRPTVKGAVEGSNQHQQELF